MLEQEVLLHSGDILFSFFNRLMLHRAAASSAKGSIMMNAGGSTTFGRKAPPSGRRRLPGTPARAAWGSADNTPQPTPSFTASNTNFAPGSPTDLDDDLPPGPTSPQQELDTSMGSKSVLSTHKPPPPRKEIANPIATPRQIVQPPSEPRPLTFTTGSAVQSQPEPIPATMPVPGLTVVSSAVSAPIPSVAAQASTPKPAESTAGPAIQDWNQTPRGHGINDSGFSSHTVDDSMMSTTSPQPSTLPSTSTSAPAAAPEKTQYKALSMWTNLQIFVGNLKLKTRRRRFKKYPACITGKELTTKVIGHLHSLEEERWQKANRIQTAKICQMLCDQGLIKSAHGTVGFRDSSGHLYHINKISGVGVHGLA